MFFHSWHEILRIVVVAALLFILTVAGLRIVGQQALANMSGYDVVFTVTLGSIIATVVLTRESTVADAVAAFATLITLQESTRWLQARWLRFHRVVREPPRVVLWEGQLLEDRLLASSLSADEVRAAVRKMGLASLSDARVVVLENDGQWSVVPRSNQPSDDSALFGLPIPGRPDNSPVENSAYAEPTTPFRVP